MQFLTALGTLLLAFAAFSTLWNDRNNRKLEIKGLTHRILMCVTEIETLLNYLESPDLKIEKRDQKRREIWVILGELRALSSNSQIYLLNIELRSNFIQTLILVEAWRHEDFSFEAKFQDESLPKKLKKQCKEIVYLISKALKQEVASQKLKTFFKKAWERHRGHE